MSDIMNNVLITGGSGLFGSAMRFGHKPSKSVMNVLNYNEISNYIDNNGIDSIIHAAAKVGGVKANTDFVYDFFADNMMMNINMLNACKNYRLKKSIFIVSTCAFPVSSPLPLREEFLHLGEPHHTNYGYAYAKRMLEVGSRSLRNQYNLSSSCVIPCNLYGENDNYNLQNGHVIPSLIHRCWLAKTNSHSLEIWGSGKAEREFMYIKDFAKIIELIFKDNIDIPETMIVSPDNVFTIEEVVNEIVKQMNFTGKVCFDKSKPEGIMKKNSCNEVFKKYFPDFKFTSLSEGLNNNIEYFIKNYELLRK
jgi:GDP-L-fucose synthase